MKEVLKGFLFGHARYSRVGVVRNPPSYSMVPREPNSAPATASALSYRGVAITAVPRHRTDSGHIPRRVALVRHRPRRADTPHCYGRVP